MHSPARTTAVEERRVRVWRREVEERSVRVWRTYLGAWCEWNDEVEL